MWNSQMKKGRWSGIYRKTARPKKGRFFAEIKERMIFMSKKIRLNGQRMLKNLLRLQVNVILM